MTIHEKTQKRRKIYFLVLLLVIRFVYSLTNMAECNRHAVKNDPKPEPSSSSLNSSLDPVEALRYSELSVSSENLRVFDNL